MIHFVIGVYCSVTKILARMLQRPLPMLCVRILCIVVIMYYVNVKKKNPLRHFSFFEYRLRALIFSYGTSSVQRLLSSALSFENLACVKVR